ncbi:MULTISPECIES: choline BCCT transporter BetT [Marichromatium]|uniref:Choline/glycine/proline betaine transport protein n=1 Tax=Marichromatium gracile TaxID=1048 RepID=A0A4R4AIF7_MARGR|nr:MULTISPECIES: choline BCCT transporter BetT [Marichromatium]MBO8085374.1 choline BCCT transporter BetT [Marichromatium sp.]MBK1708302.1 choline transporter [Marichromatium gracile]RNE91207.1 BCCT family transporter [Marichromatium sp. AB31]RNE93253.1 BCCT family transporter [Marichromatium sp. AB32]TCW38569.1 choline/glycine/proline betaine transport protein [Marichromatium gracile]
MQSFIDDDHGQRPLEVNRTVFIASAALTALLIAITMLFPARTEALLGLALGWVSDHFGWYYMLALAAYSGFVLFIALSRYGDIRLGPDHATPDFNYVTWAAMLFSAGIGIDLLFFGASEPLAHFLTPPGGAETALQPAERAAIAQTFLHWGVHGWGLYALMGMALAYFAYRHKMPLALRSALVPLIGRKRAAGWIGHTVDTFGVVCTLFGIATSLGIGVLQANAGMTHIFGIESSKLVQAAIIVTVIILAGLSAISGVERGVRRLSEINMGFATLLLIALLLMGPTLYLLNGLVQNIGDYFQGLIGKTFDVYAYDGAEGASWKAGWTVFFWAWWLAWSPFVGLFIARISRGRTLREFVLGAMFIPLGFIFAWFSIFGNSAIDLVNNGAVELGEIAVNDPAMGLFAFFDHYPAASLWSGLAVVLGLIFFITSADSGALVLANLSTKGLTSEQDAPIWLRLFWAALTGLITLGLLFAGGFNSLQSVVVVSALPFSVILLLFMWSLHYSLRQEATKRKAENIDFAPAISDKGLGWKERLSRIVHFPSRQFVEQFLHETVEPAMAEVSQALNQRGLDTELSHDTEDHRLCLQVKHGNEMDFFYMVNLIGSAKPVFALGQSGNIAAHHENERYYRAEVFLREGGQEYDLVGYSKAQVINDILNQYERHMQFLHLDR